MNSIEPTYGDRVQYKLYSDGLQRTLTISEPIGYENDEKELKRDNKFFGIIRKTSDNLKFYRGFNDGRRNTDGGYDFILEVDALGINEVMYLIKERKDNETNIYKEVYRTELDLSTLEKEVDKDLQRFCSLKGFEGGFDALIKSRKSEDVEIERAETMDGESVSSISNKTFQLKGRKIYKYSEQNTNVTNLALKGNELSLIKTQIKASSDPSFQTVLNEYTSKSSSGSVGDMFYAISDSIKTLTITVDLDCEITSSSGTWDYDPSMTLRIYDGGGSYNQTGNLFQIATVPLAGGRVTVSKTFDVTLNTDESISASFWASGSDDFPFPTLAAMNLYSFKVTVEEASVYPATQCKSFLMNDVFNRLTYLITGKNNRFKSDFFGVGGIGEYMAITDGGLVRELPNWQLKTSLNDAIDSFSSSWNLSVGVETYGYKDFLVVEELDYFFNSRVVLTLPNAVSVIKRVKAKEYIYSGLNVGYKGEGSYENIQGLDKTNGLVSRITAIKRVGENIYKKISPYGTDDYEREIPRRMPYSTHPTEDTKYDEKVMILDGKLSETDVLQQRASSFLVGSDKSVNDDFDDIPSGVFDPEGLTNGRWTPLAMVLRHGSWLKAGLLDYLSKDVSFGSSNGNVALTGVLQKGADYPYLKGIEYSENSNILASDLQGNLYYPEWITFEHVVTDEMLDTLEGFQEINGIKYKNFYGLIEFTNEDGKLDKGYLFSVKPNGNGKWKLLSYRKLKGNG